MTTVHMWKDVEDKRPWAEVSDGGRGHLLAQLLHGNLCDAASVAQVSTAARSSIEDPDFSADLGFFDSVAISFSGGRAFLEHAVAGYGIFDLDARDLVCVLEDWQAVLECPTRIEKTTEVRWRHGAEGAA